MEELDKIKKETEEIVEKTESIEKLEEILNKKGSFGKLLDLLKKVPKEKKAELGREINKFKIFITQKIEEKKKILSEKSEKEEWFDYSFPVKKPEIGYLHPLTQTKRRIEEIFLSMGFEIIEGPEIENSWYNFDALNVPENHPSRDMWDTFYLKLKDEKNQNLLLRTHTSPVQIHYMEKHQPPFRIVAPGRVFRHEATDSKHESNFYQLEGLMVDKDISVAHFKAIIENFLSEFFSKEVKIRLRPSFFPFTEPSFEIDIICLVCEGKGCSTCLKEGWIELMGAGMVHPNVFKNSGIDPNKWQGFAFGIGIDRLTMMKHKIDDIRLFYSGDLRFLQQF